MRKLEQARADRAEELKNRAIAMEGKAVSSEEAALAAAGWFTAQDQTGRIYYYNAMTRITSWEMPNVAALPSPPPPPPPPGTAGDENAAVGNESAGAAAESTIPKAPLFTRAAEETAALGSDGFTQDVAQSSPRDLLQDIQVGAMRSAQAGSAAESEQENSGQLVVYQSQPDDLDGPRGGIGDAANGNEAQDSPVSRVQTMLAQSLAGQSQVAGAGKRESIADRSRRLRETRQAEAAATSADSSEVAPAAGLADAPASRPMAAGSSVSTVSSTGRLLGGGVRNSGGSLSSSLGGARNSGGSLGSSLGTVRNSGDSSRFKVAAVGSTMGLLAARRAQRDAEKQSGTGVTGTNSQSGMLPQPGSVMPAQPVAMGGTLAAGAGDPRASWQQTPRGEILKV